MRIKAVIADDSRFMRALIKKALITLGVEVVAEASNGEEAVELVKKYSPDLLVIDINMPKKDGLQAVREIRSSGFNTKVVLLTALNQPWVLEEARKLGVNGFVSKPFKLDSLREVIEGAVK